MSKETFKYIFLIICCLFVMIFTFILKEALYNINKEDKSLKKNKYIDIGVGIENMYSNRYVDISKEKQQVVVGNNKNEVDNGYFDIKILSDGKINVYINKLFKDKFSNENLIDYIYLDELINSLNKIFNMNLDDEAINNIKKLVGDKYIKLRETENVDNVNKSIKEEIIMVQNYSIKLDYMDNMLMLAINEV